MMTKISNVCCCNDLVLPSFQYPAYNRKILMLYN